MERTEVIRARGSGARLSRPGQDARTDMVMDRWDEFTKHNPTIVSDDPLRMFAYWLINLSGLAVDYQVHRNRLASLSAELRGDRQLLARIGEVERGRAALSFSLGTGRVFVGKAAIHPSALPRYVMAGATILITISRPQCRKCGCTGERPCAEGCHWARPNLCSNCGPAPRRRRRRHDPVNGKRA